MTITTGWAPAFKLDIDTASAAAFADTLAEFRKWSDGQPPLGSMTRPNGWYDVTPELAEELLRRNRSNRKVSLQTVRKYLNAMRRGEWRATGQALLVNTDGNAEDLQHRCLASYFGGVTFPSFIITDVPAAADTFAYIDDNKPRSAADALQTSGMNGLSPHIAAAIKLAWKYENNALAIMNAKTKKIEELSIRQVLDFSRANPTLAEAAHFLISNHTKALAVIGHKGVATFFAWKVTALHSVQVLHDFLYPLGTGANLEETSPILALRNRLLEDGEDLDQPHRLALLIKGFNALRDGTKIGKKGLFLRDNQPFPMFDEQEDLPLVAD
jgi:hypothetical protein